MSVRILGGELGGRRLPVVGSWRSVEVRPTEAKVREALFGIWQQRLAGCRFLDLFAGSGAVGLEALSRGAAHGVFVDRAPRVLATLRRGCGELAPGRSTVLRLELPRQARRLRGGPFDLIFADPPYAFREHPALLRAAEAWLATGGELAIEHSSRLAVEVPEGGAWERRERRVYGESCLSFFELAGVSAAGPD